MIYVILPAYNEENDLPRLLEEFSVFEKKYPYELIVVNDGSTDNTLGAALAYRRRLPITFLSHESNLGLGAALSTGITFAAKLMKDSDVLVTMDSDNTHKPAVINALADKICAGFDIAVASRFVESAETRGVPFYRKVLSFTAGGIFKVLFPISDVNDYTSGYRAFSGRAIRSLLERYDGRVLTETGFAATLELLLRTRGKGVRYAETPLSLRYGDKTGKSKLKIPNTLLRYAILTVKTLFSL